MRGRERTHSDYPSLSCPACALCPSETKIERGRGTIAWLRVRVSLPQCKRMMRDYFEFIGQYLNMEFVLIMIKHFPITKNKYYKLYRLIH